MRSLAALACLAPCPGPSRPHSTAPILPRCVPTQVGAKRRPDGSSSRDKEKAEKAVVRFATRQEVHRALRDRQGSFCGSNSVRLRILQ